MNRDFTVIDAPQRSPEWFASRLGRVTGSKAKCVMMGAMTAGRNDYILQLALERLTGIPEELGFVSKEMQRGVDLEPFARMKAESFGPMIRETGFCRHDKLMIGASLDGDSEDFRRIWEFKAPKSTTHVKYLRSKGDDLVEEYRCQIMHNAYVTGAEFVVAGSFDDRLPAPLDWVQKEVVVKDLPMGEYETALLHFLIEVDKLELEFKEMMSNAKGK